MIWTIVLFSIVGISFLIFRMKKKKPSRLNVQESDVSQLTLSEEQKQVFKNIEQTHDHFFITGRAGTGKSVLLQYFKQHSKKQVVVCAPTGVAALNVGGQTIHSLFRIPPSFITRESLSPPDYKTAQLLRNIDTVVIDEISMVRADLMDAIDHRLRQARKSSLPFGGVQLILFGDMYQLPPIVSDRELHKYFADNNGGFYFFHAKVWERTGVRVQELSTIFRQNDQQFIEILNAIRTGDVSNQHLMLLNSRARVMIPEDGVITLATTNHAVNTINEYHLSQLSGKECEYEATIEGNMEESYFPTEELLHLKPGAQVMLLKNDKEKRWVNGSIGYVRSLSSDEVKVDIDGYVYSIPQETWKKIRYTYNKEKRIVEEEFISSFTQFPLRLAWAITIHKSQGHTYGAVAIDMGSGAFAHGQTYVALSRCRSLEGIYLKRGIEWDDIRVDPTILEFSKRLESML